MTRAILYLIAFVLVISVLRSVVGIVTKGVSELFNASEDASPPRSRPLPTADALKRDPVCGTFIAASTAPSKTIGRETYYFCSKACRDKFRV